MEEVWENIKEYEDYQVSNLGRIKSLKFGKEKILKPNSDTCGYLQIFLYKNGVGKIFLIHRLVYEAFYGRIPFWMEINHKDENPTNNQIDNLMLCNHTQNMNWGTLQKRRSNSKSKPVIQYDLEGTLIKEWESATVLESVTNYNRTYICNCCNGRYKQAYGYVWKYKKRQVN